MNSKSIKKERVSTSYLLLMTSFMASSLASIKGFEVAIAQGFSFPSVVKLSICLALFIVCSIWINKKDYFYDVAQRKRVMSLSLSFKQTLLVLVTLLFWVFLRLVLFGTK